MTFAARLLLLGVMTLSLLFALPAPAASTDKAADVYNSIDEVPEILRKYIRTNALWEDNLNTLMRYMRRQDGSKNKIDADSIKATEEALIRSLKQSQINAFIRFDKNFDAKVTEDEIEAGSERHLRRYKKEFETMDPNQDGVITYQEAAILSPDKSKQIENAASEAKAMHALDPNKDGILTAAELESLARKAFNTFDTDRDLQISAEEMPANLRNVTTSRRQLQSTCAFKDVTFPDNMVVYASGAYSGRKTGKQIDNSGHAATQFDIIVNHTKAPVALILGAYEPSVWNIQKTPGTKISAVIVGGYHKQILAGLDAQTPVLMNTHSDKKGPCGYFYLSRDKLSKLNPMSRQAFGKEVSLFIPPDASATAMIGDVEHDPKTLQGAKPETIDGFFTAGDKKTAGPDGLRQAVQDGFLRPGTKEDADMWIEAVLAAEKKKAPPDIPAIAGTSQDELLRSRIRKIGGRNFYVVLKDFELPAGLYGAHSAEFLVPRGVKPPTGNPGHSSVFDMNSLNCDGLCKFLSESERD